MGTDNSPTVAGGDESALVRLSCLDGWPDSVLDFALHSPRPNPRALLYSSKVLPQARCAIKLTLSSIKLQEHQPSSEGAAMSSRLWRSISLTRAVWGGGVCVWGGGGSVYMKVNERASVHAPRTFSVGCRSKR